LGDDPASFHAYFEGQKLLGPRECTPPPENKTFKKMGLWKMLMLIFPFWLFLASKCYFFQVGVSQATRPSKCFQPISADRCVKLVSSVRFVAKTAVSGRLQLTAPEKGEGFSVGFRRQALLVSGEGYLEDRPRPCKELG